MKLESFQKFVSVHGTHVPWTDTRENLMSLLNYTLKK